MQIILSLKTLSQRLRSQFIVIGGHAINAQGYLLSTGDLDIAIQSQDVVAWKKAIEEIGYVAFHEQPAFVQFKSNRLDAWPIDLILLNEQTFKKMLSDSKTFKFGDCEAQIASVPHLISMKLHALQQRLEHREAKDLSDLIELLKIADIALNSKEFRQACEKYDSLWVYEKFNPAG